ncbi:hypothetical protein [Empedobacter tilapiae]|uniref:hypothetical protein n=1 Tax=Empedobacter tilapiae TaxID=2491114 RepID=UPI0028D6777A|nr:hypothetical protein [Empedobacter tilapiae]
MREFLLHYLNHTKSTYLFLLLYFLSTSVFPYIGEINEEVNSESPTNKIVITIKENTTFYISENTIISNIGTKERNDTTPSQQNKILKKQTFKTSINKSKSKDKQNLSQSEKVYKHEKLFYLPYKSSTFFNLYKPSALGVYYEIFYNYAALFMTFINKITDNDIQYKIKYYHYIFCDYAICLSHLEIRSPSLFI